MVLILISTFPKFISVFSVIYDSSKSVVGLVKRSKTVALRHVFKNKVLLDTAMPISLCILYGWFHDTAAELSCDRDHLAAKG